MSSWLKLYRKLSESDLWLAEPFTRAQAWVDLLMLARFQDGHIRVRGVRVDVKRGQVPWSEVELSKRWQWSRGKVRRFLSEMEIEQQIEQQKTNVTTLITIKNWDQYQGSDTADKTASDTASRTASDTSKTHKPAPNADSQDRKNDQNGKNEKRVALPERFLTTASNYYSYLQKKFPNRKIQSGNGKVEKGAETLRKLEELDGFNLEQDVKPALKWALEDDFWQDKVLSLAELRKKKQGNENHKFFNLYQRYMAETEKEQGDDEVAL